MATNVLEPAVNWKSWHITRLGLPADLERDLDDDGIVTIGELMESEDYNRDEDVVAAFNRFYGNYPEYAQEAEDSEQPDDVLPSGDIRVTHYEQIQALNEKWYAAQLEFMGARQTASELKKACDSIGAELQRMIRKGPDPQRKLFSDTGLDVIDVASDESDDAWMKEAIGPALHLSDKQVDKFFEAGVTTMGQFETLRGGPGLLSVKGIGRALADQLEDRALEWLNEFRDHIGAAC